MGMKITGVENLIAALQQTGERAVRGVSTKLVEGAEMIQERAREYAPVDEGNLEEAITVEADRSGINGRIQAFVYVDTDVAASDGGTVGDYAMRMHEDRTYKLGPKSQAKNAGQGKGKVGPKFLERAADELAPEIISQVEQVVKKALS